MKNLLGLLADIFSPEITPGAPPTRLLTSTSAPGRFGVSPLRTTLNGRSPIDMSRMTKETIRQIIDGVDADSLAGMGAFTKKDILIDRLLAHWNTVGPRDAQQPTEPKPLLTQPDTTARFVAPTSIARPGTGGVAAASIGPTKAVGGPG